MEQLRALMSRKVAGVPVILIAAVVMAGLLYMAIRMRPSPDEEELPTDEATTDGGDLPDTSQPVFGAAPVIYQPSGGSVASTPQQDTNELWGRRAIEWLIANGTSYSMANAAISKYLNGESLTSEEVKVRDKAIAQFGIPPEIPQYAEDIPATVTPDEPADGGGGTSGPGGYQGPPSKQGEPPLNHRVTGKSDDTPAELALLYYGSNDHASINKIKSQNLSLGNPPYKVGTKVRVPENKPPKYYKATAANRSANKIAAVNGKSPAVIRALNPGKDFPVPVGTQVRIS